MIAEAAKQDGPLPVAWQSADGRSRLYHGDSLALLAQLPADSIDCIWTDPPYNLSNDGMTCVSGRMVRVNKGEWDRSRGTEGDHAFNRAWLAACHRVLKPTGTIWVSGTTHVYLSVGFAMQQLGFRILNDIVWEKCLAKSTILYVRSPKGGDRPATIHDLMESKPEDLQVWNGQRWTRVVRWEETPHTTGYTLTLRSGERITCSGNHRFPTTNRGLMRVDELRIGDILQTCQLPEPDDVVQPSALDDEIGWLVGVYIAEGCRSDGTIAIACHQDEVEEWFNRLTKIARAYHGFASADRDPEGLTCRISLNGPILNAILDTYVSGDTAKFKHLNKRCWKRSNAFLQAILDGYLAGDGGFEERARRWRLGFTKNFALRNDLRTIAARLGIDIRIRDGRSTCRGKEFEGFTGEIFFTPSAHFNAKSSAEIVSIIPAKHTQFVDIEVEDYPNLFALASGVLTHNSNPPPNLGCRCFTHATETILWATKARKGRDRYTFHYDQMKSENGGRQMKNVWRIPVPGKAEKLHGKHPTQKPVELIARCLRAATNPGDLVLDPFAGSGTTGVAALTEGRTFIGCEMEDRYLEIARKRLSAADRP